MSESLSNASADQALKARIQALNATQWLARFANSYSASAAGEIELRWHVETGRILTPEGAPGLTLGLSLPTLVLQFDENGRPSPHPIDVEGRSSTEVEAWLLVELLHRGIERDGFSKQLPYSPSHLMSGDEPKYSPQALTDDLQRLSSQFASAAKTLVCVRSKLKSEDRLGMNGRSGPSDLACWPERMEIGFAVDVDGRDDRRIKIGFAGADTQDTGSKFFVVRASQEALELPLADQCAGTSESVMVDKLLTGVRELASS